MISQGNNNTKSRDKPVSRAFFRVGRTGFAISNGGSEGRCAAHPGSHGCLRSIDPCVKHVYPKKVIIAKPPYFMGGVRQLSISQMYCSALVQQNHEM